MAGVSPATVSRYFKGNHIVSRELAHRIEAAAAALSYIPKHKPKNHGVIAVLIPNLKLAYFGEVLKELLNAAPGYGYTMIFFPVSEGKEDYKLLLRDLYILGIIYLDENMDQDMLDYIAAKNIKTVMFGISSPEKRTKIVHINDLAAAYEAARYLLSLNHYHILMLSDRPKSISSGFFRLTGCRRAFEELGIDFHENLIKYGDLTYESGYHLTLQALRDGLDFTAVFAFSDEAALGAISALSESGRSVPRDVSVMGFDGISLSRKIVPKLTTIRQPIRLMVEHTLDTFKTMREENIEITLPHKLEIAATCIMNPRSSSKELP